MGDCALIGYHAVGNALSVRVNPSRTPRPGSISPRTGRGGRDGRALVAPISPRERHRTNKLPSGPSWPRGPRTRATPTIGSALLQLRYRRRQRGTQYYRSGPPSFRCGSRHPAHGLRRARPRPDVRNPSTEAHRHTTIGQAGHHRDPVVSRSQGSARE
jgi:hypothetical protein